MQCVKLTKQDLATACEVLGNRMDNFEHILMERSVMKVYDAPTRKLMKKELGRAKRVHAKLLAALRAR